MYKVKALSIILLSVLFCCIGNASVGIAKDTNNAVIEKLNDFTFRKTKWGMTISEVKALESLKVVREGDNQLTYKTEVARKDVLLLYTFINNQLVSATYLLISPHSNKNDYIQDYRDFKLILEKKYGKPERDETVWKNELFQDQLSGWGTAVSIGHLVFYSEWETLLTNIRTTVLGDNFDITCGVHYSSKKLKEIEKRAEEKKALDVF